MYRFSRSIYRELAPLVIEDEQGDGSCGRRQAVLEASEAAVRRLMTDGRYFARPARSLFCEVRIHFAIKDQLRVWTVIERNLALAQEFLEHRPEELVLDCETRECRAHTRRGTACQREPLPGRDYCPSHKHLEETFDAADIAALERELVAA